MSVDRGRKPGHGRRLVSVEKREWPALGYKWEANPRDTIRSTLLSDA